MTSSLNARFTFERFVVCSANRDAVSTAHDVATQRPGRHNPFVICGGQGLGKTHLVQAVGHKLQSVLNMNVGYVSSEAFLHEDMSAAEDDDLGNFHVRYEALDCLLIDDISFIAGRSDVEGELSRIAGTLLENGKQIILANDQAPGSIQELDAGLAHCVSGPAVRMAAPDYHARISILKGLLRGEEGIAVSSEALQFMATHIAGSVRRLESAARRVLAAQLRVGQPLDIAEVRQIVADLVDVQG
jgi:chromosomal replication initiator protein